MTHGAPLAPPALARGCLPKSRARFSPRERGDTGRVTTSAGPVERVRARLGDALFARIAGPNGLENRSKVHETEGPRWFPPGSAIRRVHGDASTFVGGLRALLLQSLHPLAMAGVAGHSGYRGDPWGRLNRTSTFLAFTTFGA